MTEDRKAGVIFALVTAVVLYVGLSVTVYRFRHADLTETQLFLRIPDALAWRG